MIIRSGVTVTPNVLENAGRLKVIARAGVGVDNIDLDAATAKGILVMNSAEASTISTAEHAFTLLMSLMRNVGPAYKTMTEGGWDRSKFTGQTLHGKTLGVIGRSSRTIRLSTLPPHLMAKRACTAILRRCCPTPMCFLFTSRLTTKLAAC